MKKIKLLLFSIFLPVCVFAWHANGHMTAGAIAYYYLKAHNPAALQKVLATIKTNPWYGQPVWKNKLTGLTAEQKEVALFMLASTYPDDARDTVAIGGGLKKKWHYIDYPFVPVGQHVPNIPPPSPNAQEKIKEFITNIPHAGESAQKGINLCWLFHLVEDIHQPLHSAALIDDNHRTGDGGGNLTFIKFGNNAPVILHSYWDDLVKGTFSNVPGRAKQLLADPKYKESNLPELRTNPTYVEWLTNESLVLAKSTVYLNGMVNGTQNNPTPVDSTYANNAKDLGEKRVVLAGIRLAQLLSKLYA
jgi:hypothetical protein